MAEDNTVLKGWMKDELAAARAKMEEQGMSEEAIVKRLKVLRKELLGKQPGVSGYTKRKEGPTSLLDLASEY